MREEPLIRWRASLPARLAFWVAGAGIAGFGILVGPAADDWTISDLGWSVVLLIVAACCLLLVTGYIDLYPDRVVIGGRFRRHREIRLAAVCVVEPYQYGLFFRTGPSEGISGPMSIGAKGLMLDLLRIRNRGDRIAERIMSQTKLSNAH